MTLLDAVQSTPVNRDRVSRILDRRSARCGLWLTISILASCSSLTAPDLSAAHGSYSLELVDGAPLPVAIETGSCPHEIFFGELGLSPQIGSRRPLFTILVELRLQCDPDRLLPIEEGRLVQDFGEWTIVGDAVQFRSEKGFGNQLVPMDPPAPGSLGPLLTLDLDGRRYTFRRTRVFGDPV